MSSVRGGVKSARATRPLTLWPARAECEMKTRRHTLINMHACADKNKEYNRKKYTTRHTEMNM